MDRTVIVSAAIIKKGNKILIAQRKDDSKLGAGKWEFPGGKIEFGEHPAQAIVREIKEELGIKIIVDGVYDLASHTYDFEGGKLHVILIVFLTSYQSGRVKNIDVKDSKWVSGSELRDFDFLAGDRSIVKRLIRES